MREGNTIITLDNGYHLWTRTDNVGGDIQLLCLHGGPGGNHEYYENFAEKLGDVDDALKGCTVIVDGVEVNWN